MRDSLEPYSCSRNAGGALVIENNNEKSFRHERTGVSSPPGGNGSLRKGGDQVDFVRGHPHQQVGERTKETFTFLPCGDDSGGGEKS